MGGIATEGMAAECKSTWFVLMNIKGVDVGSEYFVYCNDN